MKLLHAQKLSSEVVSKIRPYVDQIEVGGSIRRGKPEVKDIEIICVPKQLPAQQSLVDGPDMERHPGFARAVAQWKKVKGDAATGKYTQRIMAIDYPSIYEKEIKIDIFIVTPENFGNMLLVRTGPAEFSEKIMNRINRMSGYEHKDGYLYIADKIRPVYTEEEFFRLLEIDFIPPHLRK
jgi:DNA polymerase/3'-5' exonuclease PolX